MEQRAENECYLRKLGKDLYQVWISEPRKITTTRIYDLVLQHSDAKQKPRMCMDDKNTNNEGNGKENKRITEQQPEKSQFTTNSKHKKQFSSKSHENEK